MINSLPINESLKKEIEIFMSNINLDSTQKERMLQLIQKSVEDASFRRKQHLNYEGP